MLDSAQHEMAHIPRPQAPNPTRVVAVTSGKGGVGKSSVCINLAICAARRQRRVMVLDADLGLANVDVLLGLQPAFDLSHVVSGQRTLEEVVVEGPEGIRLVPAASGIAEMCRLAPADSRRVIRGFDEVGNDLDLLLVDTAAGISDSVTLFAGACDEVLLVVCNEPASITDSYAVMKVLSREHGQRRFQILSNRIQSTQEGLTLFSKLAVVADRFLDVSLRYVGGIPEDPYLKRSIQRQCAVVDAFPGSPAARSFGKIAESLERWHADHQSGGGFLARRSN